MKKISALVLNSIFFSTLAFAGGQAQVHWVDPQNFKDVQTSDGSQEEFLARILNELEKIISELAAILPEGQKLEMKITDLDLAGDVKMSGARTQHQDVRIVKDSYPARMRFHYRLLDANGNILKEADEKLQSRNLSTNMRTGSRESLEIEKRMLRNWFKRSIAK